MHENVATVAVVNAPKIIITILFVVRDLIEIESGKNEWWPHSPDWDAQSTRYEAYQSSRHLGGPIRRHTADIQ